MSMEVLLMADVADLGSEGDVVKVADGYARNYLFPKKIAAPVTDATRRRLAKMRLDRDSVRKLALDAAKDMASRLATVSCTLPVKSVEGEKLYGSVSATDIADALKSQGIAIDKHCLVIDQPIRTLGVYEVKARLHPDVEATVKVWVVEE